jgi:beta-galactosidase
VLNKNLTFLLFLLCVLTGSAMPQPGLTRPSSAASSQQVFFPVSVWYSGAKARAPMLEKIAPESPQRWKEDLLKIKGLGFNTVRTWVEWNVGEPRKSGSE